MQVLEFFILPTGRVEGWKQAKETPQGSTDQGVAHIWDPSEPRMCVKVEVDVLGSPSLIVRRPVYLSA